MDNRKAKEIIKRLSKLELEMFDMGNDIEKLDGADFAWAAHGEQMRMAGWIAGEWAVELSHQLRNESREKGEE